MTTTHKARNLEPLEKVMYKCSKCGNISSERYPIDIMNLEEGFVCNDCNKKYFGGKLLKMS